MRGEGQQRLFFEDINDALREVVQQLGGAKAVGAVLWPEKSVEQAQVLLLACLNSERKERLSPEQLVLLLRKGREAGCHAAINFICESCGYSAPLPVNPVDAQAQRVDEFNRNVSALLQLADLIQKSGGTAALRVVKP